MTQRKEGRSAGVLLPLTMLPGPFGIGVLGKEAKEFADFLHAGGFSLWQILPVEHVGESFSPYKCVSAFAGEPMLIDPRWLRDRNLVTDADLDARCEGTEMNSVNYETVYDRQMVLLRTAFAHLPARLREEAARFDPFWLNDYALYMAIKENYDLHPWFAWPDEALRRFEPKAVERARREYKSMIEFYRFVQWVFDAQWKEIRAYAAGRGIKFIGDLPFYVSEDSAEVWSRREMFTADEQGEITDVAGAPPDFFAPEGQLWGNPIYNWELMERDDYAWWVERMREGLDRYDYVRIDHFRGFESYWKIPAGAGSAGEGKWVKGPGIKPFLAMKRELGDIPVIAEDLGATGPAVEELLNKAGFPGMRVMQFGILGDEKHLPHRYEENNIAYTGTHDNTTVLAFMYELSGDYRDKALFYCGYEGDWSRGGPGCGICRAWIRLLYLTKARVVIVPVQDLLGYGSDTRTNIPGVPTGNWRFRITKNAVSEIDTGFCRRLAELTDRLPPSDKKESTPAQK